MCLRSADSRIFIEEGFGQIVEKVVDVVKGSIANLFCSCLHTENTIFFLLRLYVSLRLAWGWPIKIIRRDSEVKQCSLFTHSTESGDGYCRLGTYSRDNGRGNYWVGGYISGESRAWHRW